MKINFNKLTIRDLGEFAQRVIDAAKNSGVDEIKNHSFLAKLEEDFAPFYATLSKQVFSGKGQSVAQADDQRDKLLNNIKAFLEGYARLPLLPHHPDAVALLQDFKTFGSGVTKLSYAEQTIQMSKLIEVLQQPAQLQRFKNIHLESSFEELKKAHQNFKTIFDEHASANASLRETASASTLRKDLERSLKRFLDLVTLMHSSEQWTPFYLKLNEFAKATNTKTTKGNNSQKSKE